MWKKYLLALIKEGFSKIIKWNTIKEERALNNLIK
jgi:hypothetical protein